MVDLLEIGHIDRGHGLRGEVIVTLITDYTERLAPGAELVTDAGSLRVRASQPYQHRWLVALEGVTSREAADALRGTILRAEPIDDPEALWVHDLVGAQVCTPDGRQWGQVRTVLDNPASPLLELDDGHLVPIVFVVDERDLPERIVVDPPAGLLDDDEA
jgi:16S rRNA processing protein RimM